MTDARVNAKVTAADDFIVLCHFSAQAVRFIIPTYSASRPPSPPPLHSATFVDSTFRMHTLSNKALLQNANAEEFSLTRSPQWGSR